MQHGQGRRSRRRDSKNRERERKTGRCANWTHLPRRSAGQKQADGDIDQNGPEIEARWSECL